MAAKEKYCKMCLSCFILFFVLTLAFTYIMIFKTNTAGEALFHLALMWLSIAAAGHSMETAFNGHDD